MSEIGLGVYIVEPAEAGGERRLLLLFENGPCAFQQVLPIGEALRLANGMLNAAVAAQEAQGAAPTAEADAQPVQAELSGALVQQLRDLGVE